MVSYNVSLFTSNKHPRRARARKDRSFAPLSSLSLHDILLVALSVSRSLSRVCAGVRDRPLLKIIYFCVLFLFFFFYTSYTLLPNNTINRYFLPLSSVPPRSSPVGKRAISHENNRSVPTFALLPLLLLQSFGKSPLPPRLVVSSLPAARGKSTVRYLPGYIYIYIYIFILFLLLLSNSFFPFPSPQFTMSPHLTRIIYIRLTRFAKNIRE